MYITVYMTVQYMCMYPYTCICMYVCMYISMYACRKQACVYVHCTQEVGWPQQVELACWGLVASCGLHGARKPTFELVLSPQPSCSGAYAVLRRSHGPWQCGLSAGLVCETNPIFVRPGTTRACTAGPTQLCLLQRPSASKLCGQH